MNCEGCWMHNDEESMMICEICGRAWHKDCLATPLRAVLTCDFYCDDCRDTSEDIPFAALREIALAGGYRRVE